MNKEELIEKAFNINLLRWYVKVFDLPKSDLIRIKNLDEKPRAYRELLIFLEPFAFELLKQRALFGV